MNHYRASVKSPSHEHRDVCPFMRMFQSDIWINIPLVDVATLAAAKGSRPFREYLFPLESLRADKEENHINQEDNGRNDKKVVCIKRY